MNYRQTLEYLYAQLPMFHRVGAAAYKADLSNTLAMCSLLGNPQNGFRSIHVAGTNGKGSTSHLIASVLQAAGYKTGLFTSPHLKDFRERIKINGRKIPKSYVSGFVSQHIKTFTGIQPSFFEYTAVMAFQYFNDEKVDVAIMETGMGGRLDSTNVITPVLSIITNISKDHMAYLGDTLEEIAVEKAGIIKPGVPVVVGETQPETTNVFVAKARELNSRIYFADQNYILQKQKGPGDEFVIYLRDVISLGRIDTSLYLRDVISLGKIDISLTCPLKGLYQEKNLVTAFQALTIKEMGLGIEIPHIIDGFRDVISMTGLQGRWQILKKHPKVICDVGHNEAGIHFIIEQLKNEDYKFLHWVLGMVNDKDISGILRMLPCECVYYFCKADIPRGLDANELKEKARKFGLDGKVYDSVKSAYAAALGNASENDLVFVGGSTFIVAEVI